MMRRRDGSYGAIKADEEPEGWESKPAKQSHKDVDARWSEADQKTFRWKAFLTNKHGKSHYGYKNHVNGDRKHMLIQRYPVSTAAVQDSQAVDTLLMRGNTASGVWADAVCRSADIETTLKARGLTSRIHRKGKRGKPLSKHAKQSNRSKSSVRVRPSCACKGMHCQAVVDHVFGAQANDRGGTMVHTIGLVRA